ncbi:lysophospholipid acyltransferase family protein [candidate division KSB1 bacterium]|nr:lysophospholipid acyltransferase family protein [candidate division KSB1 bacterium]
MKKLQNHIEYYLTRLVSSFILILPLKWALTFGKGIGLFVYYIVPIRKKVSVQNLTSVFPDKTKKEINIIARDTYVNFGQTIIEFMRYPRITKDFLHKHIKFINKEILLDAHAAGKGALCMSGHFGNWEIMAAAIQALGIQMIGVAKEQRNKRIDKLIIDFRTLLGVESMQLGMALRGVLKALKANKFVAMVADQDAHRAGIFVDFLGRPSSTATGPAIFALKTGVPLIFGSAVRNKNGCHTVYLKKIDFSDLEGGATEENIRILTQRHAAVLEESIKKWPDHWFWMHKRWKTKPV